MMKNATLWIGAVIVTLGVIFLFFFIPLRDSFAPKNKAVELYYADHISEAHKTIIQRFNQENEGRIRVIPVDLPFSKFSTNERKEILARSLRSKSDRLDIFSVDVIWVPRFAKWAVPLDGYITTKSLEHINKSALQSCYYGGRLVTVPVQIDVGLLYYRKDLLRLFPDHQQIEQQLKHSMRWEDFIDLGRRWKKYNKPYFIFPADNYEGFVCLFLETLSSDENHHIFDGDSVQLNSFQVRRGLTLLYNMINTWKFTPAVVLEFDELKSLNYALDNDALFLRGWPGYKIHHRSKVNYPEKLDLLTEVPLPHFDGEEKTGVFGGWNLMISKFSSKKEQAVKFLRYVLEERNQITYFRKAGYYPVLRTLYGDSEFARRNPQINVYDQLLNSGKHRPFRADYTHISDIMSYYFKMALKREITVQQAITTAMDKINADQAFIK